MHKLIKSFGIQVNNYKKNFGKDNKISFPIIKCLIYNTLL